MTREEIELIKSGIYDRSGNAANLSVLAPDMDDLCDLALEALEAREQGEDDKADAERWRNLMTCQRIRVMGRTMDLNHVGIEFWKQHPSAHPDEEYPQDRCRAVLDKFASTPTPPKESDDDG